MKKSRPRALLIAMIAATTLLLSSCAADSDPESAAAVELPTGIDPQPLDEKVTLKVNIPSKAEGLMSLFMAEQMGEFEKENVEVEWTKVPPVDSFAALVGGEVDVIVGSLAAAFVNASAAGADIRAVIQANDEDVVTGVYTTSENASKGPSALKGTTIATSNGPGSDVTLVIAEYLEEGV